MHEVSHADLNSQSGNSALHQQEQTLVLPDPDHKAVCCVYHHHYHAVRLYQATVVTTNMI